MNGLVLAANVLGWPAIHIVVARCALSIPLQRFESKDFAKTGKDGEGEIRFYRKWLAIQRWKSWLPDGAPWLGGFAKKAFVGRGRGYVTRFIAETRRAEIAHWCMFCCLPVFFLWNPLWAKWVMAIYAAGVNLPCIVVQRYNRVVLRRILYNMESKTRYQYKL
jgi:glycosyl-4,4'-diaponeurosporenoate acyltransferase